MCVSDICSDPIVVQLLSHVWLFATPWTAACQDSEGCPSPSPRVYSNSCPLSQWCHPTISSSDTPFSFCPQSFPVSGSFPVNQLFISGDQSIRASASVLPMNIQGWLPLGWLGLISLQSKGLLRVFSSTTTIQKHQFFGIQPSLRSNSYIHPCENEKMLVTQSRLTLCDPCSLPLSSVHGIPEARMLEWGAIPFSSGSSWPRDWTWISCIVGRFFTIWATKEWLLEKA